MNMLLTTVVTHILSLLLYICQASSEGTDSTVKAKPKHLAAPPCVPYLVPTKPGSSFGYWTTGFWPLCPPPYGLPQKSFGGDRSDKFLYPPHGYYERWAADEEEKDRSNWYKYGLSRDWFKPHPTTPPSVVVVPPPPNYY